MSDRRRVARWARTISTSFWLGWKVESNWTSPWRYVVYAIIRPIAGAMILVFMYIAIARHTGGPMLGFLVVGAAFWPFVLAGVRGVVLGVLEDREQHQTMRAIYTAPIPYRGYLVGRSLAQIASVGLASTVVTLLIGGLALRVHYRWSVARAGVLLGGSILGIIGVIAIAVIAVAFAINLSGESWNMPDGITAALYLVTGAIYPVTILPGWLAGVSRALPMTWWLEAMRRALLPHGAPSSVPNTSNATVGIMLVTLTIAWALGAGVIARAGERRARNLGILDARSGY